MKLSPLMAAVVGSSMLGACAGDIGPGRFANGPGTNDIARGDQHYLRTGQPHPLTGRVVDTARVDTPKCDERTGQTYTVRYQKRIDANGQIDMIEIPRGINQGFNETVNPVRCAFINTMAKASASMYGAPGGSNYYQGNLYNNVPTIRNPRY